MERRQKAFGELPEEVTTESGYCSERREELKAESRAARFIPSRPRGALRISRRMRISDVLVTACPKKCTKGSYLKLYTCY